MSHDYQDRQPFGGPAKRRNRRWLWIVAAILGLCVVGTVISAVTGRSDGNPASTPTGIPAAGAGAASAVAKVGEKAKPPAPKAATVGAGTWEVGTEVKPGTYTTTATEHCYWARLKGFDGDFESIIANGNLDAGQHGRLTVKKTDKGLELSGDCTWRRAS